jgi:hypothetical protein
MLSQCSNCGKTFTMKTANFLFCTDNCEKEHDLFRKEESFWTKTKLPGRRKSSEKIIASNNLNYQTLSLYQLHKKCANDNAKALSEWKRRWETDYPNLIDIKNAEHSARQNNELNIPSL